MSLEIEIKNLADAINNLAEKMPSFDNWAKSSAKIIKKEVVEDEEEAPKKVAKPSKPAAKEIDDEEEEAPKKATKPSKKSDDDDLDTDSDEDDNKTADEVKELAKEKIADGTEKAAIKKMITKLGGDQISDLDQKSLNKLYSQLNDL